MLTQPIASQPHIVQSADIAGGKPCIANTRITVAQIVVWFEHMGHSADEIASAYGLGLADVYAALAYYHDHRAAVDQQIRADAAFIAALRERTPSKLGALWKA